MDLSTALKWLSASVSESLGHTLREPEVVILKGTWRGLTYEQMAEGSAYSTNYLMRDVAPKLWRQLSTVFGRSVGKTSFRVALEAFAASSARGPAELNGARFGEAADNGRFSTDRFAHNGGLNSGLNSAPGRGGLGSEAGLSWQSRAHGESPAGALDNYQTGARKRAEEARMGGLAQPGGNQPERVLYRHPAVLPDEIDNRLGTRFDAPFEDKSLEQFKLLAAGKTLYSGVSLPAMSSAVMYGYSDELAQAKQWLEEAVLDGQEGALEGSSLEGGALEGGALEGGTLEGSPPEKSTLAEGASSLAPAEASAENIGSDDITPNSGSDLAPAKATGQLIGLWGLHGVGKTLLVERLVVQMGDRFAAVVRRQLTNRPSLAELSASILTGLGVATQPSQATAQLLRLMAHQPLLIVLEGIDAVLKEKALAGDYKKPYQDYSDFFRAVPGSRSCVLITGLEGPADLVRQGSYGQRQGVRSLVLSQLSETAAAELIQAELQSAVAHRTDRDQYHQPEQYSKQWSELIARYQGHPMALKAALRVIREIFNGQVDSFLQQSSVLFTDILRLLAPSFERLSAAEVNILYWLASQEVSLSLSQLTQTLPIPMKSADLVSALDSLHQRSLIAIDTRTLSPTFYPPALVKAYALHQFVGQFGDATSQAAQTGSLQSGLPSGLSRAVGQASRTTSRTRFGAVEDIIDLRPLDDSPVALGQWIQGQYDTQWQSLERLFEASARPGALVRATYHLQDETYIKRFKSIDLSTKPSSQPSYSSTQNSNAQDKTSDKAVLLVAIHQEGENLYKVCVQAQPARRKNVLPENLELRLLDSEQQVLATVAALQEDLFIQLPYFRGAQADLFTIEMVLKDRHHRENFII